MKKAFIFFLAFLMALSLVGCTAKEPANDNTSVSDETKSDNSKTDDSKGNTESGNVSDILKPDGWDENPYGMYIYDVWDDDFLPDCMPAPIEGIKVDSTTFKDYKHDTMNSDYSVGPLWFESAEDYREYGLTFYSTVEKLDEFVEAVKAKGFVGGETTDREQDNWWEFYFYNETGWFMYIFYKNTTYEEGFDGIVSVSLTDSVFQRPASVSGNPLPQKGMPESDYTKGYYIFDENYDEVDFDLAKDSFPADEHYSIFFGYYGITAKDSKEYAAELVAAGWAIEQEKDNTESEENDYYALLIKDGKYAQVSYMPYDGILQVGFASMAESLQY